MKYLALVYYNEQQMQAMSQAEWDSLNRECINCVGKLTEQGHFLDGAPLEPTTTATTLRVRDGKVSVTDGPFAETKEVLGGYYILECENLDEALTYAAKIPTAAFGSIEVRPVLEM